jgi:HTH-type transcriptional regulator / antitoxin MqsA
MQCPICAGADLIHDTRDVQYTYKGESTIIEHITAQFCPACGELILDADEGRRFGDLIGEFHKTSQCVLCRSQIHHERETKTSLGSETGY